MEKKRYVKPSIELTEMEYTGFLCLSYTIRDAEEGSEDIVPPTVAGDKDWSFDKDGDLD